MGNLPAWRGLDAAFQPCGRAGSCRLGHPGQNNHYGLFARPEARRTSRLMTCASDSKSGGLGALAAQLMSSESTHSLRHNHPLKSEPESRAAGGPARARGPCPNLRNSLACSESRRVVASRLAVRPACGPGGVSVTVTFTVSECQCSEPGYSTTQHLSRWHPPRPGRSLTQRATGTGRASCCEGPGGGRDYGTPSATVSLALAASPASH